MTFPYVREAGLASITARKSESFSSSSPAQTKRYGLGLLFQLRTVRLSWPNAVSGPVEPAVLRIAMIRSSLIVTLLEIGLVDVQVQIDDLQKSREYSLAHSWRATFC